MWLKKTFTNSKSSASGCYLAFAWFFVNFSLALLIKVLFIKKRVVYKFISKSCLSSCQKSIVEPFWENNDTAFAAKTISERNKIFIVWPFLTSMEGLRSSHRRCSVKKMFWEISQNLKENTCASLFFNKAAGLRPATLWKKIFWHWVILFSYTTSPVAASAG